MNSNESRRRRRLSDDQTSVSRGREGKSRSDALVRRGTEPLTRMAEERAPPHIAILLMGLSGVGKSTFISHLTHESLKIGHSLTSCTTDVDGYIFTRYNGHQVYLLDTPGFDDTEKDNIRILRTIAMMLKSMRDSRSFILAGVLYLHRISDVRMAGSAIKSMRLIEKICGSDNFQAVTIATTMWELVDPEIAQVREESLRRTPDYFGTMEAEGAAVLRHLNTFTSANNIVEHILSKKENAILDIQIEMADERKSLDQTAAGQYLLGEFEQLRAKYERELEELEEALEGVKDDDDLVTIISEQRRENEANLKRVELSRQELAVTPEQMEQQQQEWFAERAAEVERSLFLPTEKSQREIELEEQLERIEMDNIRQLNKLRLQTKSTEKENAKLKKINEQLSRAQAQKERALRERGESKLEAIDHTFEFVNVLKRGLNLGAQSLRRALTEPKQEIKPRNPPATKSTSRPKPKPAKSSKKKQPKVVLEDDEYDEEEDGNYSSGSVENSQAVLAAQHAFNGQGQSAPSAASYQQTIPPGFQNAKFVDYPVDTRTYGSGQDRIVLPRSYTPNDPQW